jgi:2-polyprenyl-3-methyl-5-hydroxy-6-metoxy-1,4-benzoquinol methylase
METRVSSSSPVAELFAYGGERIARLRIALLVALIAGLGFAVEKPRDATDAVIRVTLVALLVIQFRLWDDIVDREHDRQRHPERVLPRHQGHATPFLVLLGVLTIPILALLFTFENAAARIGAYGLLAVALAVVYGSQATAHGRVMRMGWVLLKYPVFVLLPLSSPTSPNAWVAATIAYLVVMFHDWATSPDTADLRRVQLAAPGPEMFEPVNCYACGSRESTPFVNAEDDLTGKPGRFTFVRCRNCRLAYQNPRLKLEHIGAYYDDEYIAHRKKTDWGWLTPFYARAMDRHDRDKAAIVERYVKLDAESEVLDVGCGAGTFLAKIRSRFGSRVTGVDFKDLSDKPAMSGVDFRCGLFYEQSFPGRRFDLITMWHFLEHDYDPPRTLQTARDLLAPGGRVVIEVPRLDSRTWKLYRERWPGLQAPQHTVLFTRQSLEAMVEAAGLEIVDYLPYGAFPAYFYLFAGAAFKLLKGRGLNLDRAILPYFLGQVLLFPLLVFERRLNLAMQTIVCRRRAGPLA